MRCSNTIPLSAPLSRTCLVCTGQGNGFLAMLLHRGGRAPWQEGWERAGSPDLRCMEGGKDAGVPLANALTGRAHRRQCLRGSRSSPSCVGTALLGCSRACGFPLNPALAVPVFTFPSQQRFPRPAQPPLPIPLLPACSLHPWQGEITSLLDLCLPFLGGRELRAGLVRGSEYPPHRGSQTCKKRLNPQSASVGSAVSERDPSWKLF